MKAAADGYLIASTTNIAFTSFPQNIHTIAMSDQRGSLARISGPDSMAKPDATSSSAQQPQQSVSDVAKPKKKKHRAGGKHKRKARRASFAASASENGAGMDERPSLLDVPNPRSSANQHSLYRLQSGNRSNTSLESEALLDHREHADRTQQEGERTARFSEAESADGGKTAARLKFSAQRGNAYKSKLGRSPAVAVSEDEEDADPTDRTPLLSNSARNRSKPELARNNSGMRNKRRLSGNSKGSHNGHNGGRIDVQSRSRPGDLHESDDEYDVNNPPSVPSSPKLGSLDDLMHDRHSTDRGRDAVINIDDDYDGPGRKLSGSSDGMIRRPTVADLAERDVCYPGDAGMSEIGEEGEEDRHSLQGSTKPKRKRAPRWPQYEVLEQWALEEKEERTHQEQVRVKRISEPVMVGGRLRPGKTVWHREESDAPFAHILQRASRWHSARSHYQRLTAGWLHFPGPFQPGAGRAERLER